MILGLDLGTNSIGWALINTDDDGAPCGIERCGVRCFEAGVSGDLEHGRDEPRNQKRREARQARRQGARQRQRNRKILCVLQDLGLFPELPDGRPHTIDRAFREVDQRIKPAGLDHVSELTWHYQLRARGLDHPLDPEELGRAVYHLARRRGFKSNRKELPDEDEGKKSTKAGKKKGEEENDPTPGTVKGDIALLENAMAAAGHRTVGEHFASLDPEARRIRGRWLGRAMLEAEFDALMAAQAPHHPTLDAPGVARLRQAIFWQRPLKAPERGRCSLEEDEKRCRKFSFEYQRFRMLQAVNHLEVEIPGEGARPLKETERAALVDQLGINDTLTWTKVKTAIGIPKEQKKATTFNLQRMGEKHLLGDRTTAALREALAQRWDELDAKERQALLDDLASYEKSEALRKRAVTHWGLDHDAANRLSDIRLEEGTGSLSLKAIGRLLPKLEEGVPYATARKSEYPDSFEAGEPLERLRPVQTFDRDLKNPTVLRTLTELRKVVNALIRDHGRPELIRIELGRDLKQSSKDRQARAKAMRQRGDQRTTQRTLLLEHMGIERPSRSDVEKALLAEECNWTCPFTGQSFGWEDLFGAAPRVDVEHILPFSRSLDNSYANKTLCVAEENRNHKGNRTPWEAYHGTDRWEDILDRVGRFRGESARGKLKRFTRPTEGEALFDDFASRQLNDTRYASRLACEYLGELYGGQIDVERTRRIQASTGGATAHVRRGLLLEGILSAPDAPYKNRENRKHHAVDAIAIALTGPAMLKTLARAAEASERAGTQRPITPLEEPWAGFFAEATEAVESIVVSHRANRGLKGALHEDTNYSIQRDGGSGERRTKRKELKKLTRNELDDIADPVIKDVVTKAVETAGVPPGKAFNDLEHRPTLTGRDGRRRRIRHVRLEDRSDKLVTVGTGSSARHVYPGANHHMAVYEVNTNGKTRWEPTIVTRLEAVRRKRVGEPVVDPGTPERRLVMTLCSGESVSFDFGDEGRIICRISSVTDQMVKLIRHDDSRPRDKSRFVKSINALRGCNLVKVVVTPHGRIQRSND